MVSPIDLQGQHDLYIGLIESRMGNHRAELSRAGAEGNGCPAGVWSRPIKPGHAGPVLTRRPDRITLAARRTYIQHRRPTRMGRCRAATRRSAEKGPRELCCAYIDSAGRHNTSPLHRRSSRRQPIEAGVDNVRQNSHTPSENLLDLPIFR